MRIKIDLIDNLEHTEVIIRCKKIDDDILKLEELVKNLKKSKTLLSFYKDNKEYYLSLDNILFFETDGNFIYAHTKDDSYLVKNKLYELEQILPNNFLRVSKSTILNINQILSITRNFPSTNLVEFSKSHKVVYVSRFYYKLLDMKLQERRNYEKY